MKIPSIICYAVAGYGPTSKHTCFTAGWCINMETVRGRFVMWCIDTVRAVRGQPSNFRWWLADVFSRWALRLRGDATPRLFGYYEDVRGNRAAELADRMKRFAAKNYPPDEKGQVDFVRVLLEGYAQEMVEPDEPNIQVSRTAGK